MTCLWHGEKDDLITGDSNGTVYVWGHGGNIITNFIKHAHYVSILPMFIVYVNNNNNVIVLLYNGIIIYIVQII